VAISKPVLISPIVDAGLEPKTDGVEASDTTFDAAYRRLVDIGPGTYADPGPSQPGQINDRHGGRGVHFDDPDGHLFELMTAPYGPEPAA